MIQEGSIIPAIDEDIVNKFSNLPQPTEQVDIEAYDRITDVPWLLKSIRPTGTKWGKRIADVKISSLLPAHLLGIVFLTSQPGIIRLVFRRWDKYEYLGWEEDFPVTLKFKDSNELEITVPSSSRLVDGSSLLVDCGDHEVSERQHQGGRKISRVLWHVSQEIAKRSSHAIRRLLKNVQVINDFIQCTCLHAIVNDESCYKEIVNSRIPGLLEAYNAILPGSYKADLVRYYLLYRYGGVYTDDKCTLRHSLDSDAFDNIIGDNDMFVSIVGYGGGVPEIAFMGARAGSIIMLKALEASIKNISDRYYGPDRLAITGNTMLGYVIREGVEDVGLRKKLLRKPPQSEDGVGMRSVKCWGEKLALLTTDSGAESVFYGKDLVWHRQSISWDDWPKTKQYYYNQWIARTVYIDRNESQPLSCWFISTFQHNTENGAALTLAIFLSIGLLALLGFILSRNPTINTWRW